MIKALRASTISATNMSSSAAHTSKYLITIVGPTAIGKTSLSIELARHFDCPIISADSRQFFKEMNIGTAKPSAEELNQAEHHFIDFLSVEDEYSAGQFERDALGRLSEIYEKKNMAIMVGGSGLYVNAVLNGFDDLPQAPDTRQILMERLDNEGLESLFKQLAELDPVTAQRIDPQNMQRVVRALEVCLASGKPYSSYINNSSTSRPFIPIIIGLDMDRDGLYERINQRVDQMISEGLLEEVRTLEDMRHLNALKTVGYRELFGKLDDEAQTGEAIDEIKQSTRRFAKRQLTWFKRTEGLTWFEPSATQEIIFHIEARITS